MWEQGKGCRVRAGSGGREVGECPAYHWTERAVAGRCKHGGEAMALAGDEEMALESSQE